MRILIYGMVGTNRGGIETYLLKMNQNMSENTIFDYVIEEPSCLHEGAIKEKQGKIYYISPRSKKPLHNIRDSYKLMKSLKGEIGAVYFNLSSLSWIFPIVIARLLGYKVYVHSHNADFIAANSSFGYRAVNYINKRLLHFFDIDRLTCSKPATDFMFMPSDKVEMIYNAINVERFAFNDDIRKKKRLELSIPEDTFVIGFVGRLQYQKNPHYLIKIMKSLTDVPNVCMIAVGDGDMREELEREANQYNNLRLKFLGNRTDVNELFQAMDIFVLPSLHEGLPYVVVEAQSSGLKCLVSNFVTEEVNFTGNVEFLSLTENSENWKQAIEKIKNEKYDRASVTQIVKSSNFNISNEAVRLEGILNHL